jgi:hyperosmotically inducible periplasmic protein
MYLVQKLRSGASFVVPPALCLALVVLSGCTGQDRRDAQESADRAKQETRDDVDRARENAKKAAAELKSGAQKLKGDIQRAVNDSSTAAGTSSQSASEKLQEAGSQAKQAATEASQKLGQASVVTQVKAKLASDVGLNSVTNVKVDVAGQIVTLSGTVSSDEQRQLAERAASQVNGVSKVINQLQVQP